MHLNMRQSRLMALSCGRGFRLGCELWVFGMYGSLEARRHGIVCKMTSHCRACVCPVSTSRIRIQHHGTSRVCSFGHCALVRYAMTLQTSKGQRRPTPCLRRCTCASFAHPAREIARVATSWLAVGEWKIGLLVGVLATCLRQSGSTG